MKAHEIRANMAEIIYIYILYLRRQMILNMDHFVDKNKKMALFSTHRPFLPTGGSIFERERQNVYHTSLGKDTDTSF